MEYSEGFFDLDFFLEEVEVVDLLRFLEVSPFRQKREGGTKRAG